MMSDTEIVERISARLKELRLKQNISRQNLAVSSGVSKPQKMRRRASKSNSADRKEDSILRKRVRYFQFRSLSDEDNVDSLANFCRRQGGTL
jgi:hypothetical protein